MAGRAVLAPCADSFTVAAGTAPVYEEGAAGRGGRRKQWRTEVQGAPCAAVCIRVILELKVYQLANDHDVIIPHEAGTHESTLTEPTADFTETQDQMQISQNNASECRVTVLCR